MGDVWMKAGNEIVRSARRFVPIALLATVGCLSASLANAQTAPETVRINVDPPSPGIRSVLIDKKYRPIINRDKDGVIIDTIGSSDKLPPCDVKLEVTLENSRVLHRNAHLCSGDTLTVDVELDGKPGQARVIRGTGGVVAGSQTPDAPTTQAETSSTPSNQKTETSALTPVTPDQENSTLKPLERAETPIDAPGPTDQTGLSSLDPAQTSVDVTSGFLPSTPSDARTWDATTGTGPGFPSKLFHVGAGANDIDFAAQCDTQSGVATITLRRTSNDIRSGLSHPVRISTESSSWSHSAIGSTANNPYGLPFPEIVLTMTDPLWQGLIKDSTVRVEVEGLPAYVISLKGSATPVRLFVAACSEAQTIIGEENTLPGATTDAGDLACSQAGNVFSAEGTRPGQIIFRNSSTSAVDVNWVDYYGGERPYARLEPGQILEQQTYVSHAWIVRGTQGQCRGIYVSRTPYREVIIQDTVQSAPSQWDTPAPSGFGNPVPPADVGGSLSQSTVTGRRTVANYLCTAGVDLNVVYEADGTTATVAEIGYRAITLQNLNAASGFHYSGEGHTLKGQVNNLTWSRPGLREVFCSRR